MKNVSALVALSLALALSLSACTKKEDATTPPAGEQVEGTTTAPAEGQAPAEEMQEKQDEAAPAPATH